MKLQPEKAAIVFITNVLAFLDNNIANLLRLAKVPELEAEIIASPLCLKFSYLDVAKQFPLTLLAGRAPAATAVETPLPASEIRHDEPVPSTTQFSRSAAKNSTNKEGDVGWSTINVFYGSDKHLGGSEHKSQCGQDKIVAGLLNQKRNGFFLDLASNDATDLSNTYHLEQDYDWSGICFEPNPRYWRRLAVRKCTVVAAVVGAQKMQEVDFFMHDGSGRHPSGGIEDAAFDNKPTKRKSKDKPVKLFTTTIMDTLTRFQAPRVIDYMSLDVEGAEFFVMKDFPFDKYKIKILSRFVIQGGLPLYSCQQ